MLLDLNQRQPTIFALLLEVIVSEILRHKHNPLLRDVSQNFMGYMILGTQHKNTACRSQQDLNGATILGLVLARLGIENNGCLNLIYAEALSD